jgi:hypothetical protein
MSRERDRQAQHHDRWIRGIAIAAIVVLARVDHGFAQPAGEWGSLPGVSQTAEAKVPPGSADPLLVIGSVYVGGFRMNGNPGQLGPSSSQVDLGLTFGIIVHHAFSLEVETDWRTGDFDAVWSPPPLPNGGAYESRMNYSALEVGLSAKLLKSMQNMEPYLVGGLGIQNTSLSLDGHWVESLVIWPIIAVDFPQDVTVSRHASGLAGHLGAGINLLVPENPRCYIGLEMRHTWHDADLAEMSGGGVDLGGWRASIALGVRMEPRVAAKGPGRPPGQPQ